MHRILHIAEFTIVFLPCPERIYSTLRSTATARAHDINNMCHVNVLAYKLERDDKKES